MTRFKRFASIAILSATVANSAFAQAMLPEPGMLTSREMTKPWPAPVGHRQPRVTDLPAAASQPMIDPEDANVDRRISGVCRGC